MPSRLILTPPTEIRAAIALRLAAGSAAKGLQGAQTANKINNVERTLSLRRLTHRDRVENGLDHLFVPEDRIHHQVEVMAGRPFHIEVLLYVL